MIKHVQKQGSCSGTIMCFIKDYMIKHRQKQGSFNGTIMYLIQHLQKLV